MKTTLVSPKLHLFRSLLWLVALYSGVLFVAPVVSGRTITLSVEFGRLQYSTVDPNYQGNTYYTVNPIVTSDSSPVTYDEVDSPAPDLAYVGTETGWSHGYYGDFASAFQEITNGVWTLIVNKGDVSEKRYTFTVSANGLTISNLPAVQIIVPADGATSVSTNTAFAWSGPAAWDSLDLVDHSLDYSYYAPDSPAPATTTWTTAPGLPLGTNEFEVTYKTNGAAWFTISVPVDNLSNPFTNWVGESKLFVTGQSGFVVSTNVTGVSPFRDGHAIVAHYTFDDNTIYTADVSGHGNNITGSSGNGGASTIYITNDAAAGPYAASFYAPQNPDYTYSASWLIPPTNLLTTLAGSFTASLWLRTTDAFAYDTSPASDGKGLLTADYTIILTNSISYGAPGDVVPMALTGHKLAFLTGNNFGGGDDTLHSSANIDTGTYVHLVVTRNQVTGEKKIYVNGRLDASDFGSSAPLNTPQQLMIGAQQLVPVGGSLFSPDHGINGDLDDIQIYSGVLADNEVANLFSNPGSTAADVAGNIEDPLAVALNAPQLSWTTSGDAAWFPETATNNDGLSAAQSGVIVAGQSSTLQTIITNGTGASSISFEWQSLDDDNDFHLTFYIDGAQRDQLNGTVSWTGSGPHFIGPGTHTLRWVAAADNTGSDSPTNDAGWVDQVRLQPAPLVRATDSPTVGKVPLAVKFKSPSVDNLGNAITTWSWYFGDGTVSSAQNPTHIYTNVGTFFPTLTTFNARGAAPATLGLRPVTATAHSPTNVLKNLPGSPVGFTYHDFSNPKSLQFLGNATNLTTSDGAVLQLTPSAAGSAGAAFTAVPLPFGPHLGFSTFFTFRLSRPGGLVDTDGVQGADGVAFLIQSTGYSYGTGGGGIGYEGISNSLAVEFDTWNNGTQNGFPGDINGNHVAVNINGVLNDPVSVPITNAMNNGNIWYAWVDYEGVSQDLQVRLSEIPIRPLAPTLDVGVDLPSILGDTNAFVGFTGGTGAGYNEQDILSWKFMALPSTRFTGAFHLTNASPGFSIKHGLVLERYRYAVAGITYTNFFYAPVSVTKTAPGQFAVSSSLGDFGPNAFDNAIDSILNGIGVSGTNKNGTSIDGFKMLAAYTNSDSGASGAVVNFEGTDFPPFTQTTSFDNTFNMTEVSYNTLMDQQAANPPPGLYPPSVAVQIANLIGSFLGLESGPDADGYIPFQAAGYSFGTELGSLTVRKQVVFAPPLPLVLLSPRSDGTNLIFDFVTVSNQSYTVWSNSNLATTNWLIYTNLVSDGYIQKITAPLTNSTQSFYLLRSP